MDQLIPYLMPGQGKAGMERLCVQNRECFKVCTGQTARANKMTADLQLMTAERDGLAARLQVLHWFICYTTCVCSLRHSLLAGYITAELLDHCSYAV